MVSLLLLAASLVFGGQQASGNVISNSGQCLFNTENCKCPIVPYHVNCKGNITGNVLKETFAAVNETTRLDTFEMYRTSIDRLPDATFGRVSFKFFNIHDNVQLETVEEDAFKGSEDTATQVWLFNCAIRGETVFAAISKLKKLTEVNLARNKIDEIPAFAFGDQPDLQTIHLNGNKIQIIGEMPFKLLPRLNYLDLGNNEMKHIEEDTFTNQFEERYKYARLDLNFKVNKIEWISEHAFRGFERAVKLDLSNNNLGEIKAEVFRSLIVHEQTTINVRNNHKIECDCGIKWLVENKDFGKRIKWFTCNGRYLQTMTPADFPNCP